MMDKLFPEQYKLFKGIFAISKGEINSNIGYIQRQMGIEHEFSLNLLVAAIDGDPVQVRLALCKATD